jgi:NADPH:quinone reductase-like Zn-dependent oxidoreductase
MKNTMRAALLRPTSPEGTLYTFPTNMAPGSAIEIHNDVPIPQVTKPDELLIQVKATSMFKDNLDWNELYPPHHGRLGNDFAGIVVAVHESQTEFSVGDHVWGMSDAKRGGMWAEYAIVMTEETVKKPDYLPWEDAAVLGTSVLTADQALFVHAGIETTAQQPKRVLVTGASGGIGMFVVQFAVAAGHHVVAATSSKKQSELFLRSIGAHEVIEYSDFATLDKCDLVVDSAGFQALSDSWNVVKPDGTIVSFDSSSWGYIEEHKQKGISKEKEGVRALYFIVAPSRVSMERITEQISKGVRGRVRGIVPLEDVRKEYETVHTRGLGRFVVLP